MGASAGVPALIEGVLGGLATRGTLGLVAVPLSVHRKLELPWYNAPNRGHRVEGFDENNEAVADLQHGKTIRPCWRQARHSGCGERTRSFAFESFGRWTMDSTVVTATAAALGSLIGASASVVTTWLTQRKQAIRANTEWKLRERESLYGEFLAEASRLVADALSHSLERPDQLARLYGFLSRMRLLSSDEVLGKAEDSCRRIVELYGRPNMTSGQLHAAFEANELDPLKEFSAACRSELLAMSSTV